MKKEKHGYPDLSLSGQDIHRAFCAVMPDECCSWSEMPDIAKMQYDEMAKELNAMINARQEDEDDKPITAIKCPSCGAMLENFKGHMCQPCVLVS